MEAKRNFYDLEDLRKALDGRISKSYLYVLIKQNKIEVRRFGKKILIPSNIVEKLLAEGIK